MEQIFRIEIPVEAIDKTDSGALKQLESTLQKMVTLMARNKQESKDAFSAVDKGAADAARAIEKVSTATEKTTRTYENVESAADDAASAQAQSGSTVEAANRRAESAVEKVADAYDEAGNAAKQSSEKAESAVDQIGDAYEDTASTAKKAGQTTGSSFDGAATKADKFTQRVEKSNQQIQKMNNTRIKLIMEAMDKASPVLKDIWGNAKRLGSKAWHVAVRMKDFITAPFRKLYRMIANPITIALSVAGIGLGVNDIVSTFNEFETGMSNVRALTGATGEDFMMLKEQAKDLGASTSFSASEAAEGMQYLAMAGWDTNQIIAAMPGLLDLAAAGSTELGVAADIVSDVMTAMGMAADEAGRAADVFAKTATSSNTTIEGLGDTLKYAAPIAHSFGLSLEEVSAMAGMMGNAGIKGSMAGTAIRSSLLSLASPTKEAATLMKKLGFSFTNTDGTMKDMGNIIGQLETKFATLTEAQRLQYAETMFGTYASSAWLGLIDQGAEVYDKFTDSLENSTGAAREMASIKLDNLAGDMEELGGAVETAKLELMDKLNPYLRSAVQWLTGQIPMVQEKIENAISSTIEKVKSVKEFLTSVFNSSDFKSADGFAEKFMVAWDKVIAQPFKEWWNGGGSEKVLGVASDIGENLGKLLHGLVAGIFAAIKGEEIDFEGMNITGIAAAGANAAKTLVSSFMSGLDMGNLAGEMPGFMKAGLFGFGAVKLGQGAMGITRTVSALKTAFGGVAGSAAVAQTATASVGTAATTAATGVAKATTVLGGLKTVLAAIPVWGWVAAAVITAAAIGIKHYTDAQEAHRQELLHMGDAVSQAADDWRESCERVNDATGSIDAIKDAGLKINVENTGMTTKEVQDLKTAVAETIAAGGTVSIEILAKISEASETVETINNYVAALNGVEGERKATLTQTLNKFGNIDDEGIALINSMADAITTDAGMLTQMLIKLGVVDKDEIDQITDLAAVISSNQGLLKQTLEKKGIVNAGDIAQIVALATVVSDDKGLLEQELRKHGDKITQADIDEIVGLAGVVQSDDGALVQLLQKKGIVNAGDIAQIVALAAVVASDEGNLKQMMGVHGEVSQDEIDTITNLAGAISTDTGLLWQILAKNGNVTEDDIREIVDMAGAVTTDTGLLTQKLEYYGYSADQIEKIVGIVEDSNGKKATMYVELAGLGLTLLQILALQASVALADELLIEVKAVMSKSTLTPEEIDAYVETLRGNKARQIEIELILKGAGMTEGEADTSKTRLGEIQARKEEIELAYNVTGDEQELAKLQEEYASLTKEEGEIILSLTGLEYTEQQLSALNTEIAKLKSEENQIYLKMADSGMKESDIQTVKDNLYSIATMDVTNTITITETGLTVEKLGEYNEELQTLYDKLVNGSKGLVTQQDIENGKAEERIALYEKQLALQREIKRLNLESEVYAGRNTIGEQVEKRDKYKRDYESANADASVYADRKAALMMVQSEYGQLRAQKESLYARTQLSADDPNYLSQRDYSNWHDNAYTYQHGQLYDRYKEAGGLEGEWIAAAMASTVEDAMAAFEPSIDAQAGEEQYYLQERDKHYADYMAQQESLNKQYYGEKSLIEANSFKGTQYEGKTLEDVASLYNTMSFADRELFRLALDDFTRLNAESDYVDDETKVPSSELWRIAIESGTVAQPTGGADTPEPSSLQTISALQYRNSMDANDDTLFTQMLKENEQAYKDAEKNGDTQGMKEAIAARQKIYDDQYKAIEDVYAVVGDVSAQMDEKYRELDTLKQQATEIQEGKEKVEGYGDLLGDKTPEELKQFGKTDDGRAMLESINETLSGLNLEGIESLDQVSDAIERINAAGGANSEAIKQTADSIAALGQIKADGLIAIEDALGTINWNATNAGRLKQIPEALKISEEQAGQFATLSGNIGNCRTKADDLVTELNKLKKSYDVEVNIKTNYIGGKFTPGKIPGLAEGGIVTSPKLSWVGEKGAEAVIPLTGDKAHAMSLWEQAGMMLDVSEYDNGGLLAPYGDALEKVSDQHESEINGSDEGEPTNGTYYNGNGGTSINVSVAANPKFVIEGGGDGDIIDQIKSKTKEIAEILAVEFADDFNEISSNMV